MTKLSLKGENKASFNLINNSESLHQTKQINVQYYYVYELVNDKKLKIE